MKIFNIVSVPVIGMLVLGLFGNMVKASSHREAPFITEHPKVDATDFYMFRSYETEKDDFVILIANYLPLQDAYGGPNYFTLDPGAVYEINIDNDGDAREDIVFQFQFQNTLEDISLQVGSETVSVPLINVGTITAQNTSNLNITETYTLQVYKDKKQLIKRRIGSGGDFVTNVDTGSKIFTKPVDNIGNKSIADYETYAKNYIYNITIPGCNTTGRMFVGQRKDPFVVNLGEVFDLVNTNPLGAVDSELNIIGDKNVTSLILEIPISCIATEGDIIGAWTTAGLRRARVLGINPSFNRPALERGPFIQVSRLGNPLINELIIGIKDKDKFNASEPKNDKQFRTYFTNPTLPKILEILFGVTAPTLYPRDDLVAALLTGVNGINKTDKEGEMLRLNTSTSPISKGSQNNLGVIGGDNAGYPNGRRLGDDVVDIDLRVVMGKLFHLNLGFDPDDAPSGNLDYTDGALVNDGNFDDKFPFLATPIAGSPSN